MRLFLPMIFITSFAFAQTDCSYTFSGKVLSNGEPLPGALIVFLNDEGHGAVADVNGKFRIVSVCRGVYKIQVTFLGFQTLVEDIDVAANVDRTFNLKEETTNLQEVVVSEQAPSTELSQNISTLTSKDLAATAGKSLGESLKEIPGVNTIQAGPGIFKPVIHGVHSNRILILNHGIRQEGQQWGAEHAPEVDPFVASQLIVIKDASAIKYGTDALGGVVVINPAPLPEQAGIGGTMNLIGQSNGWGGTTSGMIEGGLKKYQGWGWRLQGTLKQIGDGHTPTYQLTNTGAKEADFSATTGYRGKRFGGEIFFSHFQTDLGILKGTSINSLSDLQNAMNNEPPQYTGPFSYQISQPKQHVVHNLLKLTAHRDFAKGTLNAQYGLQSNGREEFDIRRGALSDIPTLNLKLNTHTLDLSWDATKVKGRQFSFGGNGMFQKNDNIPGTQRIPFIPNYSSFSGGPFAVSRFEVGRWVYDAGIRYDFRHYRVSGYNSKNIPYSASLGFNNMSATVGAKWNVNQEQSITFNLSSAWRPPHVAELYSTGKHLSAAAMEYGLLLNELNDVTSLADADFKIEKSLKFVSTYKLERDRVAFEVTGYSNYIFNYIYLKPTGVLQNIAGVYPYFRYHQTDAWFLGLDISAQWRLSNRFSLTPKASLLRASDERNHDYLVFIPSNRMELTGRYEITKRKSWMNLFAEGRVKYVMKQFRAPRVITVDEFIQAPQTDPFATNPANFDFMAAPGGYVLVNAAIGATLPLQKGRLEFRVSADNLMNTSYREYTNRFRYYANDLGRNVIVGVKYEF